MERRMRAAGFAYLFAVCVSIPTALPWSLRPPGIPAVRCTARAWPGTGVGFQTRRATFTAKGPSLRGHAGRIVCDATEDEMRARALVTTQWLQDQIDQRGGVVILDVRGQVGKKDIGAGRVDTTYEALRADYQAAHVPGAVFVDWTRDIVNLDDDTAPVQLAPMADFAASMEQKGVGTDKTVVVYDTGKMLFATRLWWALTIYGHRDVRVLDGGWKRWTLEGRPTETKTPAPPRSTRPSPASTFAASPAYPELRCDANSVRAMLPLLVPRAEGQAAELPKVPKEGPREAAHQLIDARGKVQYDGSEVRAQRGGRIPGAVNVPYKVLMDAERGGYLALDKVRDVLQARGVRVEAFDVSGSGASAAGGEVGCETILYCNGGVASTAVLFGMWQVGVPLRLLSNYDGSWGEWGNQCDAALFPVET